MDVGHGITHTVPIYEGYAIPHAIAEIELCGQDLSDFLNHLLDKKIRDVLPGGSYDEESVINSGKIIKETMCCVAQDFDAEMKQASEQQTIERKYPLPGG